MTPTRCGLTSPGRRGVERAIGFTDPDGGGNPRHRYAGLHRYDERWPAALRVSQSRRIRPHLLDVVRRAGATVTDVCAPEDPDFDALAQDTQTHYFAPQRIDRTPI